MSKTKALSFCGQPHLLFDEVDEYLGFDLKQLNKDTSTVLFPSLGWELVASSNNPCEQTNSWIGPTQAQLAI